VLRRSRSSRRGPVEGSTDQRLGALVAEHVEAIYRVAISVVRDPALAEDVVQETVIKAWQSMGDYRGEGSERAWILRIAHNTAVSTLRRIRDEATEQAVSHLCGLKDEGYRQRTTTTGIGYLLPGSSWRDWEVAAGSADEVACYLASLVRQYAQPYLRRLSSDRGELLEAARRSPEGAAGACRVAVLIARHQGPGEAIDFLRERMDGLGARTDVAAREEREMAARARDWLTLPDPHARQR